MSVKDYYDFMGMVMENTQISVIETFNGEMFFYVNNACKKMEKNVKNAILMTVQNVINFFVSIMGLRNP